MSAQSLESPTMAVTKPVTADELLVMGEGRRELIYGEVIEMAPAGVEHGFIEDDIY